MTAMDALAISFTVLLVSLMIFVVVETVFFLFFRGRRRADRENGFRPQDLHTKSHHRPEWRFYFLWWTRKPKHHCSIGQEENNCSYREERTVVTALGALQASPFQSDLVTKLFPSLDESDLRQLQGLFGPSRLLFTIKEESIEDLASEETRPTRSRSCRPSRGSREFFPSVSPIASPPFSESPLASSSRELSSPAPAIRLLIDEASWSVSSASSCEALVSPSPPRKPLKILLEETRLSHMSPPLSATASTMSPSKIVHNPKFGRTSLGSFFESPSSSSSGFFNLNRVYPVGSPKRERQYLADNLLSRNARTHMEGIPILSSSSSDFRPYSPPWQNSPPDSFSTLSPSSSPLRFIGRFSPYRISPSLYSSDSWDPVVEATRAGSSFSRIIEEKF